jgi:hypothetical protein
MAARQTLVRSMGIPFVLISFDGLERCWTAGREFDVPRQEGGAVRRS